MGWWYDCHSMVCNTHGHHSNDGFMEGLHWRHVTCRMRNNEQLALTCCQARSCLQHCRKLWDEVTTHLTTELHSIRRMRITTTVPHFTSLCVSFFVNVCLLNGCMLA